MPPPDMSQARTRFGEYAKADVAAAIQDSQVMGDAVTHWKKHAFGRKTIGFAVSVEQSEQMVQRFVGAGISAVHLDGSTPTSERKEKLRDFALGHIDVVWNVNLFSEGFDVSANSGIDATVGAVIDMSYQVARSLAATLWEGARAQDEAVILAMPGMRCVMGYLAHRGIGRLVSLALSVRVMRLLGLA